MAARRVNVSVVSSHKTVDQPAGSAMPSCGLSQSNGSVCGVGVCTQTTYSVRPALASRLRTAKVKNAPVSPLPIGGSPQVPQAAKMTVPVKHEQAHQHREDDVTQAVLPSTSAQR